MKKFIKSNIKLVIGIVIGLIIAGTTVYATTVLLGSDVSYSNTSSGLTSTNVQGVIDEIYKKADIRKQGNFISAYTYNSSTGTNNYGYWTISATSSTLCGAWIVGNQGRIYSNNTHFADYGARAVVEVSK